MGERELAVKRRKALKSLAGAGGLAYPGSSFFSGMDRTVEITIVEVGGEPFITKLVPEDWWDHEQKAVNMMSYFEKKYGHQENVNDVCIGTVEDRISGRKMSSIVIQIEPGTSLDSRAERRGVPIEVEELEEPTPVNCNESDHDPVPGGVSTNNDGPSYCGFDVTTTGKVDYNGSPAMMTCYHHYECYQNPNGETQYQCSQNAGECSTYDRSQDWLVFTETSDDDIGGYNAYIDAESHSAEQKGVVSDTGLHDLKSNDTEVYHMGRATCETGWEVEKLYKSWTPCDFTGSYYVGLKPLDKQLEGGDSGGPWFHYTTLSGSAYNAMIAPTYAKTGPDPKRGWGYAAWKIEDVHDSITFP